MPRILLITSVLPWPLRRNGGAQRSALVKRALQKWGDVDVFAVGGSALRDANNPQFDRELSEQGVIDCIVRENPLFKRPFYLLGPFGSVWETVRKFEQNYQPDPSVAPRLADRMYRHKYDLIVSRYLQPALQSGVAHFDKVPKILDFDDIDWSTLAAAIKAKPWPGIGGRIGAARVLKRIRHICDDSMKLFNKVMVTSEEDRALVHSNVEVLPNIPYSDDPAGITPLSPARESQELLFVGDLQFPPNRDGLDRFLTRVWPTVRATIPGATISVVGRGLSENAQARWAAIDGVSVVGFAPDLVDCYRRCAFTVVPIYFGGGTKIKIVESLAFGRTVVTTSHAVRGYSCLDGDPPAIAITEADADFAEACIRLLRSPAMRDAMAERGRSVVAKEFSFDRFQQVIDKVVGEVMH
jgi:glycosyltransferase involved in cell wall biosynthesis